MFGALHATAVSSVEQVINRALEYDPAAKKQFAEIAGKILLIDCTLPPVKIAIEPTADGVMLHSFWNDEADTTLQGPLTSIAALAATAAERVSFADSGVRVSGDLELLRKLSSMISQMDVDWERALSQFVGDVPAHLIGESVRKLVAGHRQALQRVQSAVGEVAQEELRLNPSSEDFNHFKSQVQSVAADMDRIVARVQRLQQALNDDKKEAN